jgi:ribonuclease P protein component
MYSFSKEERLCGEKLIERLYHNGSSFILYPFRVVYLPGAFEGPPVKVLLGAPKRRFKRAVDRNLLKRRMREAYRIHKGELLYPWLTKKKLQLFLGISYIGKEIADYSFIEKKLCAVFEKLSAACNDQLPG